MASRVWHYLWDHQNPFVQYGFWPSFIWMCFWIGFAVVFAPFETMGAIRYHEMIYCTWFLRCFPRLIWFVIAPVAFWHFTKGNR